MSDCLVPSYQPPASSMQTLAPATVSTCAATPPPAPEPTTIASYVLGVALSCAITNILRLSGLRYKNDVCSLPPGSALRRPNVGAKPRIRWYRRAGAGHRRGQFDFHGGPVDRLRGPGEPAPIPRAHPG